MRKLKTARYDAAEYLETDEDIAAYLNAVLDEGDPALLVSALGNIARAKGMTKLARDTGLTRASLYKALSLDGNPEFNTIMKVASALNIKLEAVTPIRRNKTAKQHHVVRSTTDKRTKGEGRTTRDRRGTAHQVGRKDAAS